MDTYFLVWSFIFGCFFGSFYGVVGDRLSRGKSIVKPRSFCPNCNHTLKWYELIPIFSYIIQKGKCRNCKSNISIFYPIIEILAGLLFSISYFMFGNTIETLISITIASFFIIVLVSDITYMIIPDEVTITFSIIMILIKIIFYGFNILLNSLISGLILFLIMYSIMIIGNKVFKKESLGGADIKLMFFIGLILSPAMGLFSIFLASAIALPISIYFIYKRKTNMIPFGPFLLIATYLIYLFSFDYTFLLNI